MASAEIHQLAREGEFRDAAETEFKPTEWNDWPGYPTGLPFIARR